MKCKGERTFWDGHKVRPVSERCSPHEETKKMGKKRQDLPLDGHFRENMVRYETERVITVCTLL